MSQVHEPTNEQLYTSYPAAQPSQDVARRDAGVDARLDRIERALADRPSGSNHAVGPMGAGPGLALAIVSIVMGVPITAIAANATMNPFDSLMTVVVAWAGVVGVNVAYLRSRRRTN